MAEKKGSVELSMGHLIVIIIAIILLIVAYFAYTRLFYGGAGATCDGTSDILSEIFKVIGQESGRVCNVG